MRGLTALSSIVFSLTIVLYYFGGMVPIQVSPVFRQVVTMLGLANTFVLIFLVFNHTWANEVKSKITKAFILGLLTLVGGHNVLWTIIQMNAGDYRDEEIVAIDKVDTRRKTIVQHKDDGAFGDDYRTVTVYELTSFFRIIEREKRN
ncbi:MAG TPA: hypothetical protein PLX35_07475 [Cyclobacteriaceae bacterium]|nr:hypothetical protein [Cyclobacteriaceae bacterium]